MPTLHVRNVPSVLYHHLQSLAKARRRSLSAQVISLLEDAVSRGDSGQEPMAAVLDRIRFRREAIRLPKKWPGSNQLLREDRAR